MEAFISGNILGSLNMAAGLKKQTLDEKTVLYQIEFPSFELPGIIEAHPSFSIYSLTSLSENVQISFDSMVDTAQDFHISLFSISGGQEKLKLSGVDNFEISTGRNDKRTQIPKDRFSLIGLDHIGQFTKRSWSGPSAVNSELSIVSDFKLNYKLIGSPKSELNVGIKNSVKGLYGNLDTNDKCPNHLSGNINALTSLFAQIGTKLVQKETPQVPIWQGCFSGAKGL